MWWDEYKPKEDEVYRFAEYMHAKTKQSGDNLSFRVCPYCKNDKRGNLYKFAINVVTGQFNCLRDGCGASGNMITLAKDFGFSLGSEIDERLNPQKKYKTYRLPKEPIKPKSAAVKYLENRGISQAIAERYQITTKKDSDNILTFPFIHDDEICLIKYRKIDYDPAKDNNKEWSERGGKPILFGMSQCNLENKTLIICEGQLDSLSVSESGFENAVSVPTGARGFTWIPHCWDWMHNFTTIIVFGDHEKGHITLLDDISRRFRCEIRHVREEDYKDCKDANDILRKYGKEQIKVCIKNAVALPVKRVIKLSSVKSVDIYKMPKLKTGIKVEDMLLYGGLPFGYVHIITGKRGAGKSTLANQLIIKAAEQGYNSFVYSGELQNDRLQAWFDFQIAGRKNIIENTMDDGTPHRFITRSNEELIHAWYDDKIYIYDNTMIKNEQDDLLQIIEDAILQYNIKVVLLDNLMIGLTLMSKHGTDKYERQAQFVLKLREIAQTYDTMILLVAHRRKDSFGNEDMNDEVSGSSDVTNLAGIVLGYDRLSQKQINDGLGTDDDRILRTSKNRLFGKVNLNGFVLKFDEKSKRVYGDGDNVDYDFGWKTEVLDDRDNPFD